MPKTLRDEIAIAALRPMLGDYMDQTYNCGFTDDGKPIYETWLKRWVRDAYRVADAMMAERDKGQNDA